MVGTPKYNDHNKITRSTAVVHGINYSEKGSPSYMVWVHLKSFESDKGFKNELVLRFLRAGVGL